MKYTAKDAILAVDWLLECARVDERGEREYYQKAADLLTAQQKVVEAGLAMKAAEYSPNQKTWSTQAQDDAREQFTKTLRPFTDTPCPECGGKGKINGSIDGGKSFHYFACPTCSTKEVEDE
jgi:predicted RNA-binding Zn-ribbon protein involved in translation (DUF1610 family)